MGLDWTNISQDEVCVACFGNDEHVSDAYDLGYEDGIRDRPQKEESRRRIS